jgi:PAS domain S-box-containing protein
LRTDYEALRPFAKIEFEAVESNEAFARQGAELREQAELLNLAYDAIVVRSLADRILFWNWGAERLYGWTAKEAVGRKASELWQTIFPQPEKEVRRAFLRDGRWEGELSHLRRDGSRVVVASRWALQCGEDLQHKILQVNLDVTERKEVEEERRRLLRRLVQAQEEERRRLSRELHDHFGQQLTALQLGLESLRESGQGQPRWGERVEELRNLARRLDADVGSMAWELRPTALDDFGLASAIGALAQEWSKRCGVPAEFHAGGLADGRFAPEIETNLFRIAQEALNNVSKHAQASRVCLILERRDNQVSLIVEDDGVGFDSSRRAVPLSSTKGLGLIGMRERASLIGGEIEIESSPGAGATIFVRVPCERAPYE